MSRSAYDRFTCHICGRRIAVSGLSKVMHYRKHVREGRMIEIRPDRWPDTNIRFEDVKQKGPNP